MTTSPDQPPPQPGVTFEQLVRALQATVDDLVKQVSELRLRQEEQAEQLKQLEGPPAPLPASLTSPLTMFLRWDATKGRRLFGFSAGAPDPIHPLGALKTNDLAHLMPWRCEALLGLVVDLLSLEIVKGLERHAGEGPGARLSCHWIWTRAIFRRGPAEASPEGPSGDQRLRRGRSREHPASAFRTDLSRLKNVLADVFLMDMTDKPFPRARQGEDVRPLTITTDDFGAEQDQRESWTPVFGVFAQLFELEDAVGRCAADPAQIEPHLRRLLESDPANLGTLWRMAESNLAPPAGLAAALALCVADRREDLVEMLRGAEEDMPYLSLPRDLLAALTKLAARLSAPGPLPVPPRTGWQDPEALEARVTDACLALEHLNLRLRRQLDKGERALLEDQREDLLETRDFLQRVGPPWLFARVGETEAAARKRWRDQQAAVDDTGKGPTSPAEDFELERRAEEGPSRERCWQDDEVLEGEIARLNNQLAELTEGLEAKDPQVLEREAELQEKKAFLKQVLDGSFFTQPEEDKDSAFARWHR